LRREEWALTQDRIVVVFGATGFLGQRIVRHLFDHNFAVRAVSRHPGPLTFRGKTLPTELIRADVNDDGSVVDAVAGAFAVINAVSLYAEQGHQTFESVHVEAAARVARHSRQSGVRRLLHLSGIGANRASPSPYIASRGRGESAVRDAFSDAVIIRPAVMFGADDALLNPLISLMRTLPAFPMFGRGHTRLQPSCAQDVAEAIARVLDTPQPAKVYELTGPQIYTYQTLLRTIRARFGFRSVLVPVPFGLWHALALVTERFPHPPLTRTQVELMKFDNVASADCPGFQALGINPRGIAEFLAVQ
jgi:uncharacterized protein YbjT (DUF2867 family)